jgi:hypothetical protein
VAGQPGRLGVNPGFSGIVSGTSGTGFMLQCTMSLPLTLRLGLDDLLADLRHARRGGNLGRLALIAYCDVRRWARQAGEVGIAKNSAAMFTDVPHANREVFLQQVDSLMLELEQAQSRLQEPAPSEEGRLAEPVDGLHASQH